MSIKYIMETFVSYSNKVSFLNRIILSTEKVTYQTV